MLKEIGILFNISIRESTKMVGLAMKYFAPRFHKGKVGKGRSQGWGAKSARATMAETPLAFASNAKGEGPLSCGRLNADVRTLQYFLQLVSFLLSGLLFGIFMGCGFSMVLGALCWHKATRLSDRQTQ
jgi:hypothetical protein